MRKRISFLLLILVLVVVEIPAQQIQLTLEDCIQRAQTNSPGSRIRRKSYEIAWYNFRAFRAGLKPRVILNSSLPGFTRSIAQNTLDDGSLSFVSQNQAFSSANLQVEQPIAATGGSLSLRSSLNRIDILGTNASTTWNSVPLLVTYSQPIFAYNSLKWDKRLQPMRFKIAETQYLEGLEDVAVEVTGRYFDAYIAYITMQNAEFNVAVNDTVYKISRGRFNVGKIAENQLLSTELALMNARTEAERSRLNYEEAMEDLKISLGLDLATPLVLDPPTEIPAVEVNLDFAVGHAMDRRSEVQELELRKVRAESDFRQVQYSNRFNANIDASFGLNQSSPNLPDAYDSPLDQQMVNMRFSIPIFQWGKVRHEVAAAEATRDQQIETIELTYRQLEKEVKYQVLRFLQLQEQVELAAKSDTIAQRSYEVAKNRYLIGKTGIIDLQNAQREKDGARTSYIQTLRNYWTAYFSLRRATLFDFARNESLNVLDQLE